MICRSIYNAAMALLGEDPESVRNEDYSERAPFILANVVGELSRLDGFYRAAHGLPPALPSGQSDVCLPLTEVFPLVDRFAGAVAAYLASQLIINSNSELSDSLFDRFVHSVTAIGMEIPAESQRIPERYR